MSERERERERERETVRVYACVCVCVCVCGCDAILLEINPSTTPTNLTHRVRRPIHTMREQLTNICSFSAEAIRAATACFESPMLARPCKSVGDIPSSNDMVRTRFVEHDPITRGTTTSLRCAKFLAQRRALSASCSKSSSKGRFRWASAASQT